MPSKSHSVAAVAEEEEDELVFDVRTVVIETLDDTVLVVLLRLTCAVVLELACAVVSELA